MAQSVQSASQTSKKTIIANFKLDLSKCKQDDDDFGNEFVQSIKSSNMLSSIMKQDHQSSINQSIIDDSQVHVDDIILMYNEAENIENMAIKVDKDSFRDLPPFSGKSNKPKDAQTTGGGRTGRDPTPAPKQQQRSSVRNKEQKNQSKEKDAQCSNCKKLENSISNMQGKFANEYDEMKQSLQSYQSVLIKIKKHLNLAGNLDFTPSEDTVNSGKSSKKTLKLNNFSEVVNLIFKRMYQDLENLKIYNTNLETKVEQLQNQAKGNGTQTKLKSFTNRHGVNSIDLTDQGTPEAYLRSHIDKLQLQNSRAKNKDREMRQLNSQTAKHSSQIETKLVPKARITVKDKGILKIKMNEIQKVQRANFSDSSYSDLEQDDIKINSSAPATQIKKAGKKKSAKTVRNPRPLSSKEIKSQKQQNRVNSNPKFYNDNAAYHSRKTNDNIQYIANTFSSNQSLSQKKIVLQSDEFLDSNALQESITENSAIFLNQIPNTSQLQILPNGVRLLHLQNNQGTDPQKDSSIVINGSKIQYQSNTSRSGGKVLTGKKVKSPAVHHMQTNLDQGQNAFNLSQSNKKSKIQSKEKFQDRESLSSEVMKTHQNYKTSRIPVTSSLAFIDSSYPPEIDNENLLHQQMVNYESLMAEYSPQMELHLVENQSNQFFSNINNSTQNFQSGTYMNSSQITSEKRGQKQIQNNFSSVKQSFKTQRKMTQGRNMLQPNSGVQSVKPVENKTQRIQRQLLNKSGAANIANIISLQQTYDQDIRKQSINGVIGLSGNINENNSVQYTKRPQSVAERNGRKLQKIQHQMYAFNKVNRSQMHKQKQKYKSKSTERKNSRQGMTISRDTGLLMKNNQLKFSNARIEQQVHNLSANIQNIQLIKSAKFSNKHDGSNNLSNRVNSGLIKTQNSKSIMAASKQSSVLSN